MCSVLLRLLLVALALCVPAHSAIISYTDNGTFTSSTPNTPFSGPSETWAFAFQTDTHPMVLDSASEAFGFFDFAVSNFSYSLNGSPVAITPTFIRFGSSPDNGGWLMCFHGTTALCNAGLSTLGAGPQMFSGNTSAPTLIPGAFTSDIFDVFVNMTSLFTQPNTTVVATLATVPEPTTLLMVAASLALLGGRRLYRRM